MGRPIQTRRQAMPKSQYKNKTRKSKSKKGKSRKRKSAA